MRAQRRLILPFAILMALAMAAPGSATHGTRTDVFNMINLGDVLHPVDPDAPGNQRFDHTDLAFWGDYLINGNYNGFKVIDISDPANPEEIVFYDDCNGNQGDVLVWENLVIRSWNSPAPDPDGPTGRTCGGEPVPQGFEGLHIFDISDLSDIQLVGSVELTAAALGVPGCGSHTATLVPDVENGRLLVYNSASSGTCPGIDIVEVPLSDPSAAAFIRREPAQRSCHDTSVILLDDLKRAVCAGGNGMTMFSMDEEHGGTLVNPAELYSQASPLGASGHSSSFTTDGSMFAFGTEPGGGVSPRCQESTPSVEKTMFFYDTHSGNLLGRWVLPRNQTVTENCTIHNFNVIPTRNGRHVLAGGHYQAGTWVVDFTDPSRPRAIAWSDPPPIDENVLVDGGAWSSYWYNGEIYESDIYTGLHVFRPTAPAAQTPVTLDHLNPQTQLPLPPGPTCGGREATIYGAGGDDFLVGTPGDDVIHGRGGNDTINGRGGNDVICGGPGADIVRGQAGNDRLLGGAGDDRLLGGPGDDTLRGGPGTDVCRGGPGTDRAFGCESVFGARRM